MSSKADNNVSGTGYCKMPDGTLMVFGQSKIYPRSNSGTAAGALYQYICDTNITFSPSFNSTPYVSISKLSGNSGFIAWVSYNAAAITEVDLFSTASSLPTPTAGFIILWFAIGRWK